MATTAIWNIRGNLFTVINYAENKNKTAFDETELQGLTDVMDYATRDYKTEKRYYVSGINCFSENAREQMITTKKRFAKTGGNIPTMLINPLLKVK